jgi:uncharacterized membrane protein required for colicin V production
MVGVGDAVLGALALVFLAIGFRKGMSLGLFVTAGVVISAVVALLLSGPLGRTVGERLDCGTPTASGIGFVVVFGVGLALVALLRGLLKRSLDRWSEGLAGSIAGALTWCVLGLVFIVLCLSVLLAARSDLFQSVAHDRSAACRLVFDRVPLLHNLRARIEQRHPREPETPTDVEELEEGFRHRTEGND